ncbi:hypothetical protein GYH30_000630 [Glycine max]|nr:hypothetical protein GYH30_000630 [Glycine max]
MLLTTFFVVLIGCVVVFIWCRSSSPKAKPLEPPKRVIEKLPEIEVDDDTKKVTILFSTQTGTVEGFAKLHCEEQLSLMSDSSNGDRSWRLNFDGFQLSLEHTKKQVKPPRGLLDCYGVLGNFWNLLT